jgi:hypothetical protein
MGASSVRAHRRRPRSMPAATTGGDRVAPAELDPRRVAWQASVAFTSHGVRIGVRTNDPDTLRHLAGRLPPDAAPSAPDKGGRVYSLLAEPSSGDDGSFRYALYLESSLLGRAQEIGPIIDALEAWLDVHVAIRARRHVFVHAGVVGWRGRAIVLPGPSTCGKTSLVAALVRAGATYYSDEYAVLDVRGRVHPYPKPLAVREGGRRGKVRVSAATLGAVLGDEPLPAGLIAALRYRRGAAWRPHPLSSAEAVLALLASTIRARLEPQRVLPVLSRAARTSMAIEGRRDDAEGVAHRLLTCLDEETRRCR